MKLLIPLIATTSALLKGLDFWNAGPSGEELRAAQRKGRTSRTSSFIVTKEREGVVMSVKINMNDRAGIPGCGDGRNRETAKWSKGNDCLILDDIDRCWKAVTMERDYALLFCKES